MKSTQIQASRLRIPLRHSFKHAAAERAVGDSLWVESRRGEYVGLGEGCPRPYVTGESSEAALQWIESQSERFAAEIDCLAALRHWTEAQREEIDAHPSAWCAVELAFLDLFGKEAGVPVETLLGIPKPRGVFHYSAVVGDEALEKVERLFELYLSLGFCDFKLKISGDVEADRAKIALLRKMCSDRGTAKPRIRMDANNLWSKRSQAALAYFDALELPIFAVEEPLAPRASRDMSHFSATTGLPVILDESLCRLGDLELFCEQPGSWIGNVRISKLGGLLRSLEVVEKLRALEWPLIVGAQVGETSLLTRAALVAAGAADDALIAQEGAFGTYLLERDAVTPVLQFGHAGALELPATERGGLGLCSSRVE